MLSLIVLKNAFTMWRNLTNAMIMLIFMLAGAGCKHQPVKNPLISDVRDTTDQILYVGTYTETEDHGNGQATGIYIYKLDRTTGRLTHIGTSPETTNPSYIQVHPEGNWLFAVNETGSSQGEPAGSVSAFRLTHEGKAMEFINSVSSEGNYPCYIQVDQTGKYVMVANYGTGNVALFPVNAGRLAPAVSVDQHTGRGPTSNQETAHAHMITVSRNNHYAYSCDLGTDQIYVYELDTENGRLISTGNHYAAQPGSGPRHLVFHPFRDLAYVINELNGTIECMKADTGSGTLTRFQIISTVADGIGKEASCADIHITPSGQYLYASNRGDFNNIAMYSIHSNTGELTLIGHQTVNGKTPRNFIIDPTGTFLLVANQNSDNVVTFRIDRETGILIDTGIETIIPAPVCLKFLPQ
jgi:6-phosphogluconolactonase